MGCRVSRAQCGCHWLVSILIVATVGGSGIDLVPNIRIGLLAYRVQKTGTITDADSGPIFTAAASQMLSIAALAGEYRTQMLRLRSLNSPISLFTF